MTHLSALPDDLDERMLSERRRAAECAAEPIRTIGRIQSYGFLLAVDEASGTIVMSSDNAAHWLGRDVRSIAGDAFTRAIDHALAIDPVRTEIDGDAYDVIVHRDTSPLLVELEPAVPNLDYVRTGVVTAIQRLSVITDPDELRATAAREIKRITGYDRVMCYEFYDDGHGQVVADEREPDMEPYLGLHFPASDIPSQARALYLEKRSRMIADTEDPGFALSTILEPAPSFDLGLTELRSASPHHLQFMRNMGQAATVSFALATDDRLVGMFTCAHRTPRRLPALLRRALEVLATLVTSQLMSAQQIRSLTHRLAARERRAAVIAPLYGRGDVSALLMSGGRTVLDVVPADGAVVQLGSVVQSTGQTPPADELFEVVDALGGGAVVTDALPAEYPELARLIPGVAGILAVPLGDSDRLVFVRGEVAHTVDWLGDQRATNREHALSPRRSFSAWREDVRGHSLAWGEAIPDAHELGQDIEAALAARAQAELAELAGRDPLTGLYNRRFLDDRIDELLRDSLNTALVFIDLDHFKSVNDTYGHEMGDSVLAAVGRRLAGIARSADVVARFGGDEFVIACADTDEDGATAIAARAVEALSEPIIVGDVRVRIGGSAGVVSAWRGATAAELLSGADAAMYRAKRDGGGRVSA